MTSYTNQLILCLNLLSLKCKLVYGFKNEIIMCEINILDTVLPVLYNNLKAFKLFKHLYYAIITVKSLIL